MEFKAIFNRRLNDYVTSGASVVGRLNFLILLFQDMKINNLDIEEYKEIVIESLKVKFSNDLIDRIYEVIVLRDVDKAISLTKSIKTDPKKEPLIEVSNEDTDHFPQDVPDVNKEVFKNRKIELDLEFLKSVGWVE
jgi:SAM-dependent MidA family methyltransferase